jgi:hypothetical protein
LNQIVLNPAVGKRMKVSILPTLEDVEELRFVNHWLALNEFKEARVFGLVETCECQSNLRCIKEVGQSDIWVGRFPGSDGDLTQTGESATFTAARASRRQARRQRRWVPRIRKP